MQTSQAATIITIEREDLAVAVAPHAREGDQREVAAVEHQLQAEQHDQRVAPREHADRAEQKTSAETARYQAMFTAAHRYPAGSLGLASAVGGGASPPTPSAIVPGAARARQVERP